MQATLLATLLNNYYNLNLPFLKNIPDEMTLREEIDDVMVIVNEIEALSDLSGEWSLFAVEMASNPDKFDLMIEDLSWHLKYRTYVAGYGITFDDFVLFSAFAKMNNWANVLKSNKRLKYRYIVRYFNFLATFPAFAQGLEYAENFSKYDDEKRVTTGTFDPLEGAVEGEVVVRFPPEPSGFLHIGHAKAAFTNDYYRRMYKGKMILRFDDTNPSAEKEEFEEAIIKDLATMGIKPDSVSHTSDYFDLILSKAVEMIQLGRAYMDDTDAETINIMRRAKENSPHRDNSIEKNMAMWEELVQGTETGKNSVLRAKIDMQSDNGTMRDPVIYRHLGIPHIKTGDKFLIYPIYNFACPIVDSHEGVTHACRSNEYHDSEEQYYWFLENIPGCRPVKIQDFSRLNFTYMLMSKRKLAWFVREGYVEGWHDARFPTVQGIVRKGLSMSALRDFVIDLGNSKSAVLMDINKLWAFNKQVIDSIIPRYTVVRSENLVTCEITDITEDEIVDVLKCKLNPDLGNKQLVRSKNIIFDQGDVVSLEDGEEVTIMDWGNIIMSSREKNDDVYTTMTAVSNIGGDFKKTKKLTWIAESSTVPVLLKYYEPLITVPTIPKDGEFKDYVNLDSELIISGLAEASICELNVGDTIQFTRRGYFRFDKIEDDGITRSFINIPDGHEKNVWI